MSCYERTQDSGAESKSLSGESGVKTTDRGANKYTERPFSRNVANGRRERIVLIRCPARGCGADLEGRNVKTSCHIASHAPEDFGLAPLGEGRSDDPAGGVDRGDRVVADGGHVPARIHVAEGGNGLPPAHHERGDEKVWLFTCVNCGKRWANPIAPVAQCGCGGDIVCHRFDHDEYSRIRWYDEPRVRVLEGRDDDLRADGGADGIELQTANGSVRIPFDESEEPYVADGVDRGDGPRTDGGRVPRGNAIDPLVCPRGHHSIKVTGTRFHCKTCRNQGRETTSFDRSDIVDLREQEPPLADTDDERELVTDGGREVRSRDDRRPAFVSPHVEFVVCFICGETLDPEDADGIDVSADDEYYPKMRPVCPHHGGRGR